MSFGVVLEGMVIAAFVVLLSDKQKREQGWKFMATMVVLAAVVQLVATTLVVSESFLSHLSRKQWEETGERGRDIPLHSLSLRARFGIMR